MTIPKRVVTVDAAVFNGRGDLLLIERQDGLGWALPGGVVEENETVEQAVVRELQEETQGLWPEGFELKLLRVFSAPGRDPRGPTISVAFFGIVADRVHIRAGDDARRAEWVDDWERRTLAFDHAEIARYAWAATGLTRGPLPSEEEVHYGVDLPEISFKQRQYLQDIYIGVGAYRAPNNPTFKALQSKGCVKLQRPEGGGAPCWTITELGRAVISG